jgi:hypothetical protein
MTKKGYCENKKSIAYYSGLNGLEIKGIEYDIDDFIYCVSNCWHGGKKAEKYHKCKIYYTNDNAYFFVNKCKILLSNCIAM